jgi:hypothetical protein
VFYRRVEEGVYPSLPPRSSVDWALLVQVFLQIYRYYNDDNIFQLRVRCGTHDFPISSLVVNLAQCCESAMFIPGQSFFYPGSRVKKIPGSASAKNLSILTQKIVYKLSEI